MGRRSAVFSLVAGVLATLSAAPAAPTPAPPAAQQFAVRVVSSAPHQVTGGDARLHIDVPLTVTLQQVEVWAGGTDRRSRFSVLLGTRIPFFRSPVPGLPMVHW